MCLFNKVNHKNKTITWLQITLYNKHNESKCIQAKSFYPYHVLELGRPTLWFIGLWAICQIMFSLNSWWNKTFFVLGFVLQVWCQRLSVYHRRIVALEDGSILMQCFFYLTPRFLVMVLSYVWYLNQSFSLWSID